MATDTIYDYPLYYDILFGFDRSNEAEFYLRTFARCGITLGESLLEVACGPARIARLLARRGFRVTGLDLSPAMLELAHVQADAEAAPLTTLCADMTAFSVREPFGAAYNPISSLRLLHSDSEADAHLRCMAAALRPAGVYVIDLGFLRSADEPVTTTSEGWQVTRGEVTVRGENEGVTVTEAGITRSLAWGPGAHLRGYTTSAFAERVAACPEFSLESWHPAASGAAGDSGFSLEGQPAAAIVRRAMVVLRRR
jgi:SAM-dependent methyltransferase